jgi:WD40 repeat protein
MIFRAHSSSLEPSSPNFKRVKWAPDGSCVLTTTDDGFASIYNYYEDYSFIQPAIKVKSPSPLTDFDWYPQMNSNSPETCAFIVASSNLPVRLYDAYNGSLRAKYNCTLKDEPVAKIYSSSFSTDGNRIFCGVDNHIILFDSSREGGCLESISLKPPLSSGIKRFGCVSSISFSSCSSFYALGSFSGSFGLYDYLNHSQIFISVPPRHARGISHLMFSSSGNHLFVSRRMNNFIEMYDIRYLKSEINHFERNGMSNQRIYFDLVDGKHLISGDLQGNVNLFLDEKKITYKAHEDVCSSVSVHPFLSIIATSSGQRTYDNEKNIDNSIRIFSMEDEGEPQIK